jgi:2-phosphoglycolate phosphatase
VPRGIIFDLDGTLIDSRRDIATAINRMRSERQLAPLTVAEVGRMVGEGARVLVRRALPPPLGPIGPLGPLGSDELRQALASYLRHYEDVCLDTTVAWPGVPAMLSSLAQGFALGVLSNKGEALCRRILDSLGLGRFLREVVGGDTLPTRKPNPGGLFLLADRLGIPAERLLLVGDSEIDALTAQAAGCPFALTVWGLDDPRPDPGAPGAPDLDAGVTAGASPAWCFAHPADLQAAFGMPEDD